MLHFLLFHFGNAFQSAGGDFNTNIFTYMKKTFLSKYLKIFKKRK